MKKQLFALLALSTLTMVACKGFGPNSGDKSENISQTDSSSSESSSSEESTIIERKVTVNFYLDYNQVAAGKIYFTTEVDNGGLILEQPANPTEAPYPEFPVFKGWSAKEIINNENELWNFATDKVVTNQGTFSIYGFWVAEGE